MHWARCWLAAIGMLVISLSPASATPVSSPVRDKWALIVGISQFANKDIPPLRFATKDAKDFRNYLVNEANFAPDHVRVLLDDMATRDNIVSEIFSKFLGKVAKPDDLVVIYFSTHGSPNQLDPGKKNFVVAYDTKLNDLFTKGIEMEKILEELKARVPAERVLLVMDTCHSAAVEKGQKGLVRTFGMDPAGLPVGSGQIVICSSRGDEPSWESRRYPNGIFTRKLIDGLKQNGNIGSVEQAFSYVKRAVADEVQEDYGNRQTPTMINKWKGDDLLLAVYPAAPQPIPMTVKQELGPDSLQAPRRPATAQPAPTTAAKDWRHGVELFKRGDYASAADVLSKAVKSSPAKDQFDAHYYLANAYSRLNKRREALDEFRRAFALKSTGKESDYCLQMIQYYSAAQPSRATNVVTATQAVMPTMTALPAEQSQTAHVDSKKVDEVRAKMPRLPSIRAERPNLSEILNWQTMDKANYASEAEMRVSRAESNLEDAKRLIERAKSMASSLVPNNRLYGESPQQFEDRKQAGSAVVMRLLEPYYTEVEVRERQYAEQQQILNICKTALTQLVPIQVTPYGNTNNRYKRY